MYAYVFRGKRYDVGDKLGFLEATVDFALKKPELRDDFMEYLNKVCTEVNIEGNKNINNQEENSEFKEV